MDAIQAKLYAGQHQPDPTGEAWRESYASGGNPILDQGAGTSQSYIKDLFEENVNSQAFHAFNLTKQPAQPMGSSPPQGEGCKERRRVYRFLPVLYELNINIQNLIEESERSLANCSKSHHNKSQKLNLNNF